MLFSKSTGWGVRWPTESHGMSRKDVEEVADEVERLGKKKAGDPGSERKQAMWTKESTSRRS